MHVFDQAFQGEEHQPFFWPQAGAHAAALLVHGFPGTPDDVRPVARLLHEAGWTVQGILLPGFGSQITTLAQRRCPEWVEAVRAALADLKQHHQAVLLVGFSMGGALALQAAAVEPPAALVLLAPFWKLDHLLWTMLPVIWRILPTVPIFRLVKLDFDDPETRVGILTLMPSADLDDPQVRQAVRDFRLPVRLFAEIRQAGAGAYHAIPRVHVPTLVIQGTQDELVLPHLTRRLIQRFPNGARLLEVQAAHDLTDPTAPAWPAIAQAIMVFSDIARKQNLR